MYIRHLSEYEHSLSSEWDELSRHNGFDRRLCFGDIILAFRFFPDGLPEELFEQHKFVENAVEEKNESSITDETMKPSTSAQTSPNEKHKWIHMQTGQGMFEKHY